MKELKTLQNKLGYTFNNPLLLIQSLTHNSYSAENKGINDNQRLEFLGDSLMGAIVSLSLFTKFPDYDEGKLTKAKSATVNKVALAEKTKKLGLGKYLILGRGEDKTGGRKNNSNLASALEAILGAVYLDGGFKTAYEITLDILKDEIRKAVNKDNNYKSKLQEYAQAKLKSMPVYEVISEKGPANKKHFKIKISLKGKAYGIGIGKSKKEAEQLAAKQALNKIVLS